MPILVQKSRRPRRWAGVASFAALVVALWWTEHDSAPALPPATPEAAADTTHHAPTAPLVLSGLGPSFSNEPLATLPESHHTD